MSAEQLARDFGVRPENIKAIDIVEADGDLAVTVTLESGSTMQLVGEMAARFRALYDALQEETAE
ncbi:MAG: hypothetical protein PHO55_11835 [Thiomonas arsenitoxydans]|nr:hypothetical protein [Thiomonas arsenitoxydans]